MKEIIQGESKTISLDLTSKKTGKSLDLTGATDIKVCFKAGTTIIEKTLLALEVEIIGNPVLGQVDVKLTIEDTKSLSVTEEGIIVTTVDFSATDRKKGIEENAFTVAADPCDPP